MGLKFKTFKAKLNWKIKQPVPEVVCLRYHINSEFSNCSDAPVPPRKSEVIKQKKISAKPSLHNLFDNNNTNLTEDIKISYPPKSILKKNSQDPINIDSDSEEFKKSTLIFMTQNHDYEDATAIQSSNEETETTKQKHNINNKILHNDTKTVNWRKTVEYHSDNENDESSASGNYQQNKPEDKHKKTPNYGKGNVYSNEAASIFFAE